MASKLAILALLQSTKAATFTGSEETMPCFSATTEADATVYNGQYCLTAGTWDEGQCCDNSVAPTEGACSAAPQSIDGAYTPELAFCGTKSTISNKFLREFLMPQETSKCPAYAMQSVTETQTIQVHTWNQQVPDTSAYQWHCKYGMTSAKTDGYTYLIAENYGFDNNVIIIVQPKGKFLDFNFRSQTNNPDKMTKVFKSSFGRKYLIPAEYDIFIDFAPISYAKNSDQVSLDEGKFQYLAKWVAATTDYETDDTVTIVERLPSLDSGEAAEIIVVPVVVDPEDEGGFEPEDNTVLPPAEKRESAIDDSIGAKWRSWKDNEAFGVGGISVSNEEAVVGSTAIIIVIVGVVLICCFVSYLERKKIAEEARRASAYAKRASQKIRRSIKSMRGQDPGPEEPAEAPKTAKEIKNLASENATNKNEKAFLNDMFTDQQKADAEAAAAAEAAANNA